ncbi:MAG TPA: M20/M25/M40 family metallo-hydrolase [Thermoanaerobaculia bacterium]|jgi:acetylornithine deacetylase/succinyl-diaminopimelate desuccinylase-like protein|nr:M20/M25/M40 family metallo-hydrolase [Thermoanaerobaculia bacterium]
MFDRPNRFSPFERKRRAVSRIALYASALGVAGIAIAFVSLLERPLRRLASEKLDTRDYLHLPAVDELRRYVRIDTSDATGDEIAGARFLAGELAAAGIPSHIETMGPRKANLWAVLEGKDPRAIVLHHHIDVEDIHPNENWFAPPFEGRIEMPWMYGRGTFDMKSVGIAQLRALIALKKSGRPLQRSVIFLATSSEETGSDLGVRWLLDHRRDLVSRFGLVLTEGGFLEARTRDDIKYWGIEIGQKHYVDLDLCGPDRAPLDQIHDFLAAAQGETIGLRLLPEVRDYMKRYAPSRDHPWLRQALADPDALVRDPLEFSKLPRYLKGFFRDEALPLDVEADAAGGFRLRVILHLLRDTQVAEAFPRLVPPGLLHGLAYQISDPAGPAGPSPADSADFATIRKTLADSYPEATIGPALLPWTATDSRFFRAAGIPSYGLSPFLILSTDTLQVDNANERMALPGFVDGVELYESILSRLAL